MNQEFPDIYHPAAFMAIDPASPGGRVWTGEPRQMFQFLGNGSFSDSVSAEYNTMSVIGRSENYQIYSQTGNRSIPLTLKFIAQGTYGNTADAIVREVKEKADWFRALAYPTYRWGRAFPPPVVLLHFGRMYSSQGIPIRGIVTDPNITYCDDESPIHEENLAPYSALCDLTFLATAMSSTRDELIGTDTILDGRF